MGAMIVQQLGTLLAIVGLVTLGIVAVLFGHDGDILTAVIAGVAGLGGSLATGSRTIRQHDSEVGSDGGPTDG